MLVFGCKHENPEYDSIPFVEFLSAPTATDSSDRHIYFNFMLYDGDGNFGLETFDTASPFVDEFQQNFHSVPFYIENKETIQLPYAINYRIPRLRNEGNNKFIKAKVTIDIVLATSFLQVNYFDGKKHIHTYILIYMHTHSCVCMCVLCVQAFWHPRTS